MAKKIQLQDASGNVLHPLTLGECVAMSNGENLDTLMSKSQMFTPTITQDKSMFKVGTGVDVDYSANVKDGAYESLVFKGKSLVNLSNLHKSFNDETLSGYYSDTSLCETSKLKLGTPYTLVFYTTVHGGDHDIYNTIELGVGNVLHGADAHPKTTTNHRGTLVKNGWSKVCVTFTDFLGYKYLSLRPIRCNAPESGKSIRFSIEGFILLEGDWSNKDLPFNDYFDGIGYAKMPILRNVGKNLINEQNNTDGRFVWTTGEEYSDSNTIRTDFVRVPSNTTVYSDYIAHFFLYDRDKQYLGVNEVGNKTSSAGSMKNTLTIDSSVTYVRIYWDKTSGENNQLTVSSSTTPYENHKTNILRTSEEIVLRSLPNGVCDTYNARTGEYVKRIGERTLNGSEAWIANSGTDKQFEDVWVFHNQESLCNGTVRLCDKLQARENANENAEFIRGGGAYIFVYISKNKVQNHNANDFKTWLQSNPITVQYELAEPVTTIVKPSTTTPFAYQNGHVILESGFEGQSLLPEIEYSVVTGRTGQVTQNTKVLRQQEQQIIGLEELLLTQIVQMEYEHTLLQFDYELQMMMLG